MILNHGSGDNTETEKHLIQQESVKIARNETIENGKKLVLF